MRRSVGLVVGLMATVWVGGPAQAAWTSSATGTATAQSAGLAPATGLVASCGLVGATVKLDWTASASAWADGYEIRRGTSPGVYTFSATTAALTYTTSALGTGTYYFTVRATVGPWRSANSNEVSKTIAVVVILPVCL